MPATGFAESFNDQLIAQDISAFETYVFSTTYENQSLNDRLSRLETVIFGEPQSGVNAVREQRLSNVLKPHIKASQAAAQNNPNANQSTPDPTQPEQPPAAAQTPQNDPYYEPDATSYPTITALERQVIGRDFVHEEISKRLTRLEERVFRKSYPQMALADRVDKLLAQYPDAQLTAIPQSDYDAKPSALDDLPSSASQFVGARDTYTKLELLEQSLYGRTFAGELITERLDRLEEKAYGYSYNGQAVDTRLSRLLKNHENGFAGTEPRPGTAPRQAYASPNNFSATTPNYNTTNPRPPQNIQIGAGMMSNSQYSYSPELVNMLPPDMRQQVYQQSGQQPYNAQQQVYSQSQSPYGNQSYSQQSNVYMAAPGSITTTREYITPYGTHTQSTQYSNSGSGYNTYGGPPIQYQNYYSPPAVPQNNGQISPPVYTGNPAVFQALTDLEAKVYGAVNTTDTVPVRLSKLEAQLIGQTYEGYPDIDRVNNLNKVYQYQSLGKILGGGKTGNVVRGAGSAVLGIPLNPAGGNTTQTPTP